MTNGHACTAHVLHWYSWVLQHRKSKLTFYPSAILSHLMMINSQSEFNIDETKLFRPY